MQGGGGADATLSGGCCWAVPAHRVALIRALGWPACRGAPAGDAVNGAPAVVAVDPSATLLLPLAVPLAEMTPRQRVRMRWRSATLTICERQRRGEDPLAPAAAATAAAELPASGRQGLAGRMDSIKESMAMVAVNDVLDPLLLSATTPEALRSHVESILAAPAEGDRKLQRVQKRIRKGVAVFGMENLVARLHSTLVGDEGAWAGRVRRGKACMHAAWRPSTQCMPCLCFLWCAGRDPSDLPRKVCAANPSRCHPWDAVGVSGYSVALRERLATDFNRRWQLLSAMVDYFARYFFVISYLIVMISLGVALQYDTK